MNRTPKGDSPFMYSPKKAIYDLKILIWGANKREITVRYISCLFCTIYTIRPGSGFAPRAGGGRSAGVGDAESNTFEKLVFL